MTITFTAILFALFFISKGLQKNIFFILYAMSMILAAYYCENNLGWRLHPFTKNCLLGFILFHLPFVNLFTFLAYGHDKHLAKRGEWRIPEIQLHTLEILGGTIGAFIGQKFFHHKNKKKSYMFRFFLAVIIQICVIAALLYHFGII